MEVRGSKVGRAERSGLFSALDTITASAGTVIRIHDALNVRGAVHHSHPQCAEIVYIDLLYALQVPIQVQQESSIVHIRP